MDIEKQCLKGSPARDTFKHWHKQWPMPKEFYATDLDFILITKYPSPCIVAVLDYKRLNDSITFAEVIAYNELVRKGIPVYIIKGKDASVLPLSIWSYETGDYHPDPPQIQMHLVTTCNSVEDFIAWERRLRNDSNNP